MALLGLSYGFFRVLHHSSSSRWFEEKISFLNFFFRFAAVDGWAARRFNQVSRFGAWLDVIIDNIGRGMLWTRVSTVKKEEWIELERKCLRYRSEFGSIQLNG